MVSSSEDCHNWFERYGEEKVKDWMEEVKRAAVVENQIFLRLAKLIQEQIASGKRVLFHCSSGTDRVGRLSMIIEEKNYGLTQEELAKYRGPLTSSKIDLIVLHYLLSQRAGSDPQFRFLFPDVQHPEKSWLELGLREINPEIKIPYLDELKLPN